MNEYLARIIILYMAKDLIGMEDEGYPNICERHEIQPEDVEKLKTYIEYQLIFGESMLD